MSITQSKWDIDLKIVDQLNGGLVTNASAEKLQETQASSLVNVNFREKVIQPDSGIRKFHSSVRGVPLRDFQFKTTTGISYHLLVTTLTMYVDVGGEWQYVSDGTSTTTTASAAAGATALAVTSITGFGTGVFLGITLDNGSQHKTSVSSSSGGTINLVDPIPVGRSVANGALIVKAPLLTGSKDLKVNWSSWPPNDWAIITNGADHVKYFDGVALQDLAGLTTINVDSARQLLEWHGHLFLFDVTISGARHPQRVVRSNGGNPTVWNAGDAGFDELVDTDDFILQPLVLGPFLILYRNNSIMRGSYTSDPTQLVFWEYTVTEQGGISSNCAVDVGDTHIFISADGVFKYSGQYSVESIGDAIFESVLSHRGDLNSTQRHKTFVAFIEELQEVWIFYAASSETDPGTCLKYSLIHNSWWLRKFTQQFTNIGFYVSQSSQPWSQLAGPWTDQLWAWSSRIITANAPTIQLTDATNQVWEYNYLLPTDDGAVIEWFYQTKNYLSPKFEMVLDHFVAMGRGNGIVLDYSTDAGETWRTYGALNFGTGRKRVTLWKQITAEQFMFRFSGNDPAAQISWYGLGTDEGSEW